MMKITLLLVTLAVAYTNAQFHSAAELFNGAYSWVHLQTPQGQLQNLDKIGNIGYWPAYPGALYGNMTVSYGTPGFGPSSACATVMTDFSSYTGGYQVFPNGNGNGLGPYVEHYPIISSNPINGKTPVGVPAPRYYHLYEDDTLLDVCSFSGTAPNFVPGNCLRWRRNFPLPGPGKPNASVKLTRSGGWSSNGVNYNQYQVTITNTGGTNLKYRGGRAHFSPWSYHWPQ